MEPHWNSSGGPSISSIFHPDGRQRPPDDKKQAPPPEKPQSNPDTREHPQSPPGSCPTKTDTTARGSRQPTDPNTSTCNAQSCPNDPSKPRQPDTRHPTTHLAGKRPTNHTSTTPTNTTGNTCGTTTKQQPSPQEITIPSHRQSCRTQVIRLNCRLTVTHPTTSTQIHIQPQDKPQTWPQPTWITPTTPTPEQEDKQAGRPLWLEQLTPQFTL